MRVLFAIKGLVNAPGGAERVLTQVANALSIRGHDISVLTYDSETDGPFYPLNDCIKLIRLAIGDPSRAAGFRETLQRAAALRNVVIHEAPDVAVGFMHSMFLPLAVAMGKSGIPIVASEHIVPDYYKDKPFQRALLRLTPLFVDRITIISEDIRLRYPKSIRDKSVVITNPVDVKIRRMADPASSGSEPKTILSIGRLTKQKDHLTLLEAFSRISRQNPDWVLKIFGRGELHDQLVAAIRDLGLTGRASIHDPTSNIFSEYEKAQIYVTSSLYESFGLTTAEALCHGLPAIGFADCLGTNDIIEDQRTGVLVMGDDRIGALAAAMEALMRNPELRRQFGASGPTAMQRYALELVVDRWESLLLDVASKAFTAERRSSIASTPA